VPQAVRIAGTEISGLTLVPVGRSDLLTLFPKRKR